MPDETKPVSDASPELGDTAMLRGDPAQQPKACECASRLLQLISGSIGLTNHSEFQQTVLRWWNAARPELEKSIAPCPCEGLRAELGRERDPKAVNSLAWKLANRTAERDALQAERGSLRAELQQVRLTELDEGARFAREDADRERAFRDGPSCGGRG